MDDAFLQALVRVQQIRPPGADVGCVESQVGQASQRLWIIQRIDVHPAAQKTLGRHILHADRYPQAVWSELEEILQTAGDLAPIRESGQDRVYRVQPRTFDASDLQVRAYLPAQAGAGQPYAAYLIVGNDGGRSYAVPPTDVLRPSATWQSDRASSVEAPEADIPLVTSGPGAGPAVTAAGVLGDIIKLATSR